MSRCRVCPAEIRWARTAQGRLIPLDAEQNADGNVLLDGDTAHVLGNTRTVPFELAHLDTGERWMPHHATCPSWGRRG